MFIHHLLSVAAQLWQQVYPILVQLSTIVSLLAGVGNLTRLVISK